MNGFRARSIFTTHLGRKKWINYDCSIDVDLHAIWLHSREMYIFFSRFQTRHVVHLLFTGIFSDREKNN